MRLLIAALVIALLSPAFATTFTDSTLQPPTPASGYRSSYNATIEFASWRPLEALRWIASQVEIDGDALFNSAVHTIFAPTNAAFLHLTRAILNQTGPAEPHTPQQIAHNFVHAWAYLSKKHDSLPTLQQLLMYHILKLDLTEHQLKDRKFVPSRYNLLPLNCTQFPLISGVNPRFQASRQFRQIETTNARIVMLDRLLLPVSLVDFLTDEQHTTNSLFYPLSSPLLMIHSRSDVSVFSAMLALHPSFTAILAHVEKLNYHILAPTNVAFAYFANLILPTKIDDIPHILLLDDKTSGQLAFQIMNMWKHLAAVGFPPIDHILLYHILKTSDSYADLLGKGAIDTMHSGNKVQIADSGLKDQDPNTEEAKLLQPLTTRNGHISIINRILMPFDSNKVKEFIAQLQKALAQSSTMPTPSYSGKTTNPDESNKGGASPKPSVTVTPATTPSATKTPAAAQTGAAALTPGVSRTPGASKIPRPSPTATGPTPTVAKSASPSPTPSSGSSSNSASCFPADATVTLVSGNRVEKVKMQDLQAGDSIITHSHHTRDDSQVSPIFLFTHRQHNARSPMIRLTTHTNHSITLSQGHYIHSNRGLVSAGSVRQGDILQTDDGPGRVVSVKNVVKTGIFAPHTLNGELVVNGIHVSSYTTAVHPGLAHSLLAPFRVIVRMMKIRQPVGRLLDNGGMGWENVLRRGRDVYERETSLRVIL